MVASHPPRELNPARGAGLRASSNPATDPSRQGAVRRPSPSLRPVRGEVQAPGASVAEPLRCVDDLPRGKTCAKARQETPSASAYYAHSTIARAGPHDGARRDWQLHIFVVAHGKESGCPPTMQGGGVRGRASCKMGAECQGVCAVRVCAMCIADRSEMWLLSQTQSRLLVAGWREGFD